MIGTALCSYYIIIPLTFKTHEIFPVRIIRITPFQQILCFCFIINLTAIFLPAFVQIRNNRTKQNDIAAIAPRPIVVINKLLLLF